MPSFTTRRLTALSAAALLATLLAIPANATGPISIQLNGKTLNLNPAPTERAGRVFVPLRGVFENLGASVVYAAGVINATGRGHTVSLHIGSQQATVDGQPQTVDVAPFIIGASTYVPLRFVSQALGATVNYDGANNLVAISTNGAAAPPPQTVTQAPTAASPLRLGRVAPPRGQAVEAQNPTIAAEFVGAQADPNTVRVALDGLDVTERSTRQPQGIVYAPPSPLITGNHTVRVSGKDTEGRSFSHQWSFISGTRVIPNSISGLNLQNGQQVSIPFTVSGNTLPGAHVIVQAGVVGQSIGGLIGAILGGANNGGSTARNEVDADANGHFSTQVTINAPSGAQIGVKVDSSDTKTGAAATTVTRTVIAK
jgi:hypothetical protein